jgi:hypothetical protein
LHGSYYDAVFDGWHFRGFQSSIKSSSLQQETQLKSMTPEERMLAAFNDFKDEKQLLQAQVSQAIPTAQLDCTAVRDLTAASLVASIV